MKTWTVRWKEYYSKTVEAETKDEAEKIALESQTAFDYLDNEIIETFKVKPRGRQVG